jgi:hypothetical protein
MIDDPEEFSVEPEADLDTPAPAPAAPKRGRPPKAKEPEMTTYRVVKAAIAPNGGSRADVIRPGETVALTKEQAKHYNALGFLAPVIED